MRMWNEFLRERKIKRNVARRFESRKVNWRWFRTDFNRKKLVNHLLRNRGGNNTAYLEIGCFKDELFSAVTCADKTGVDPVSGGTHRMTSDAFFQENTKKFDVIFIDGLHEYRQVSRDAQNAINALKPGGWIAFHDMLPRKEEEQLTERTGGPWTGDCWKTGLELANTNGLQFKTITADFGLGLARVTEGRPVVQDLSDTLAGADFNTYLERLEELNLTPWRKALKWIDSIN